MTVESKDLQAAVDSLTSYLLDNTDDDQGFEVIGEIDQARTLIMEFMEGTPQEQDIQEMRLCEVKRVHLKPDTLYLFTVDRNCPACLQAEKDSK